MFLYLAYTVTKESPSTDLLAVAWVLFLEIQLLFSYHYESYNLQLLNEA